MDNYYHEETKKWFGIDHCENCGDEVLAPNSVTANRRPTGSILADTVPAQELCYSDDLGANTCEDCCVVAELEAALAKSEDGFI